MANNRILGRNGTMLAVAAEQQPCQTAGHQTFTSATTNETDGDKEVGGYNDHG